ncbi:ABC transporter ATP-binding protein [Rothia sp. CCM 9418]|uniref:ABC transporter ATP-binding protein n=1 Tax=Rothia sp. CCM 9418 TaxID=3402661 RepID=UPI003AE73898
MNPTHHTTSNTTPEHNVIIQLKDVYKTFTQGDETIYALNSTNFTARRGEFIALLGPSGSGKSTLLTLIGGLQQPTGGSIHIDGTELNSLNEKERAHTRLKTIGFVLQSSNLIPYLTVNDQLTLFDRIAKTRNTAGYTQADKDELLETLGILHIKNKYETKLSGGEKQRAAIARALYAQPAVILADEPTAALDTKKAYEVAALLKEQAQEHNTCIIMVTHDERLTQHVDTVYRMEDGILNRE